MAKYSFLLFMIPLLISAISITSFRKIIINQKILLSIGVFILVVGPHAYWLSQHYQEVFLSIDQKLKVTSDNLLVDRIKSVGQFIGAAIAFVIPFSFIFIINSWKKILNTDTQSTKKMVDNPIEITDKFFDKFRDKESAKQYLALCN